MRSARLAHTTSKDISLSEIISERTTAPAESYGKLKEKLAVLYPDDIEGYCDGKDAFVKALEKTALDWYRKNIEDRKIWKEK